MTKQLRSMMLVLLTAISVNAVGAAEPALQFHVSVNGDDASAGTVETPFRSLERARNAIREMKKDDGGLAGPITVFIHGGTYRLDKPIRIFPEDSGTADAPITYRAAPGETVLLSGGQLVEGWRVDDQGRWSVELPEVKAGHWSFSQLYVNNQRRYWPCVPAKGYFFIAAPAGVTPGKGMNRFVHGEGELDATWRNLGNVEFVAFHKWSNSRLPISEIDPQTRMVTLAGGTWHYQHAPLGGTTWYRVENVAEALDEPGEWYLDRSTGVLTYIPQPGEALDQVEIIAPRLPRLVDLSGDVAAGTFVEHVRFEGITFAHTNWNVPERGKSIYQAAVGIDGTIHAQNARDCAFRHCVVRHTGNHAIRLGPGCARCVVESCELFDLGGGGVQIGSDRFGDEPDAKMWASHCTVRDTLVAHGGRVHPGSVGIWIGHAHHNTVEHNTVADLYYSGISVGWRWGGGPSAAHHNTIRANHIYDIGQGVLSDLAGIYTLGESPETTLTLNRIHDVSRARYGGWGIYFDESSADIVAENNLVYRTEDAPFHLHYGQRNIVRNNIFAFGANDQIKLSNMKKSGTLRLEQNIWLWQQGQLFKGTPDEEISFARNLYWKLGGEAFVFADGQGADQWRKTEPDFVVADPRFADPLAGDFRLPPDSPVATIGFAPFDIELAGRLSKENLTDALPAVPTAFDPAPAEPPVEIDEGFEYFQAGQAYHGWEQVAASAEENIRVTDETAAAGAMSLKFNDGPGGASYFPHAYRYLECAEGIVHCSFDLRVEPGAQPQFEIRDADPWFRSGPSLAVQADGKLTASGRELLRLPYGKWVHLELRCGVGPQRTGTYDVGVRLPGQDLQEFVGLPCREGFETVGWIGWISNSKERVVYYVDNFKLHRRPHVAP